MPLSCNCSYSAWIRENTEPKKNNVFPLFTHYNIDTGNLSYLAYWCLLGKQKRPLITTLHLWKSDGQNWKLTGVNSKLQANLKRKLWKLMMNSTLICFLFPKFIYFTKIQLHKIIGKLMVHNKMNIDERYNRTGRDLQGSCHQIPCNRRHASNSLKPGSPNDRLTSLESRLTLRTSTVF